MVNAFFDMILHSVEPQAVINYGAEAFRFLRWLSAVGLSLGALPDLRVAGYIRNSAERGKSVPARVRHCLLWLQRIVDVPFGVDKFEIQRMVLSSSGPGKSKEVFSARMIPIEIVRALECGCWKASIFVLGMFCGSGCMFTFGIKRWSDALRIDSLKLAEDALVVRSWKSVEEEDFYHLGRFAYSV